MNGYESLPVKVPVRLHSPEAGIELEIDTTSLKMLSIRSSIENFGYNWFVNQQSVSDKQSFPLQIPISPFEIELIVIDETGCKDSTTRLVTPKISPDLHSWTLSQ